MPRLPPHQGRPDFAGLDAAAAGGGGGGGLTAADWEDRSRILRWKAVPTLRTATARTTHQRNDDRFATDRQSFAAARGGVIARVWRSMRQKSNRPLRSM